MPKRAVPLSAQKVARVASGRYFDGDGLSLLVRDADKAWWVYRFTRNGRTRDIGLGRARGPNAVSLSAARAKASELRAMVLAGRDPLAEREADEAKRQAEAQVAAAAQVSFRDVADRYIKAHETSWRNPKHRQQWSNTLRDYVFPAIGAMPISAIETGDITKIIEPLWATKPETASRIRGRIEVILDYGRVMGWRDGENPARWKGHLANILPARAKVQRVKHHAALPWEKIASTVIKLRASKGIAARAVEFAILTATRSNEVRGARWEEIDLNRATWTIPGSRMKAAREHRIPLSDRALEILQEMSALGAAPSGLVFPGQRAGSPLSDVALSKAAKAASGEDITVHGFRSTFRDWIAEATGYPRELGEKALAHTLSDKVEAAYQRRDMIEKRTKLMADWAAFCERPLQEWGGNVAVMGHSPGSL